MRAKIFYEMEPSKCDRSRPLCEISRRPNEYYNMVFYGDRFIPCIEAIIQGHYYYRFENF